MTLDPKPSPEHALALEIITPLSEAVVVVDNSSNRPIAINPSAHRLFGPDDTDVQPALDKFIESVAEVITAESSSQTECSLIDILGKVHPIHLNARRYKHDATDWWLLYLYPGDIISREHLHSQVLKNTLVILNEFDTEDTIISHILRLIVDNFSLDTAIFRAKRGGRFPVGRMYGRKLPDDIGEECPTICTKVATGTISPHCSTTYGSFLANDLSDTPLPPEELAGFPEEWRSLLVIPLYSRHRICGLMEIADRHPDRFDKETAEVLEHLSTSVGLAISRSEDQNNMRVGAERIRNLLHNNFNGIVVVDLPSGGEIDPDDIVINEINPAAEQALSCRREDAQYRKLSTVFPQYHAVWAEDCIELVKNREITRNYPDIIVGDRHFQTTFIRLDDLFVAVIFSDITDQVLIEQKSRDERELLETVVTRSPIGISVRDRNGRLLLWNDAWKRLWAMNEQDIERFRSERHQLSFDDHDDYLDDFQAGVARVYREGGSFSVPEARLRSSRPGKAEWVSQHFYSLPASDGSVDKVVIMTEDITRRKKTDLFMWRYTMQLEVLNEVEQTLLNAGDIKQAYTTVLTVMHRLLEFDEGFAFGCDSAGNLELLYNESFFKNQDDLPNAQFFPMHLLRRLEIVLVDDLEFKPFDSPMEEWLWAQGYHSYVLIPIVSEGHLLGIIGFLARKAGQIGHEDSHLYRELKVIFSIAVRQALLREKLRCEAETNTTLLREVNHRVKNNLTAVLGLLSAERNFMRQRSLTADDVIREISGHIQNMATVHSLFSHADWSPLPIDKLLRQTITTSLQVNAPKIRHQLDIAPEKTPVNATTAHRLALLTHEIISNSTKYANVEPLHIRVEFETNGNVFIIRFRDNGVGFPDEVLQRDIHQVGLYLIKSIVTAELRGRFSLRNENGAVVEIHLPRYSFDSCERDSLSTQ